MKEQEIRKQLPDKLRKFRLRAGLTAKDVGNRIGKSDKTVSGWEHGRGQPDADMLFLLCEIYGIENIAEFYSDHPSTNSNKLSKDEEKLISYYRTLDDEVKDVLLKTAKGFADIANKQKEGSNSVTA